MYMINAETTANRNERDSHSQEVQSYLQYIAFD